jgi:peroxiredoxin
MKNLFLLLLILPYTNVALAQFDHSAKGLFFPPLSFLTIDNEEVNSSEWKNKTVVITLGFKDCPPCRARMTGLGKLYNKFKDDPDFKLYYISHDDVETTRTYHAQYKAKYPLVSMTRKERKKFCTGGNPTYIIIDRTGKVIFKESGGPIYEDDAEMHLANDIIPIIKGELKKIQRERKKTEKDTRSDSK